MRKNVKTKIFKISSWVCDQLKIAAAKEGTTMSRMVERAIVERYSLERPDGVDYDELIKSNCEHCGGTFEKKHGNQRFCSTCR